MGGFKEHRKEASETGKIGKMYKNLRRLGGRDKPAGRSTTVTVKDFKEHFERVSKDRYEEDPRVVNEAVGKATDLRGDPKAREANEAMNEVPEREEILEALKEMRESTPGIDGVRVEYIKLANEEIVNSLITIVRKMFVTRADEWDQAVRTGAIIPLHKKETEMIGTTTGGYAY